MKQGGLGAPAGKVSERVCQVCQEVGPRGQGAIDDEHSRKYPDG